MQIRSNPNRLMFVATNSGAGKTTVVCSVLKALIDRGEKVSSFKCGPDYIDPMFHSEIIGTKSCNLDVFMMGEDGVKSSLCKNSKENGISIIEGVMGMYDGLGFDSDYASSNHLSLITKTPTILIVGVRGMSFSLVAMIEGFLKLRENNIRGVILNHCNDMTYPYYKEMIETNCKIKVYGYMSKVEGASLESRHLGLVTASEVSNLKDKIALLGREAQRTIELDLLLELSQETKELEFEEVASIVSEQKPVTIGVARDKVFSFIYSDNIRILNELGVKIKYFSPLNDELPPPDIDGLMFFGGYPELYMKELSMNSSMRTALKEMIESKMPTYAECGGFMYLLERMSDGKNSFDMLGVIEGESFLTKKLVRFGYQTLTAKTDNLLFREGESVNAHEFHYSDSTNNGTSLTSSKKNRSWDCVHADESIFAGFPHLNFVAYPQLVLRFLSACTKHKQAEKV